MHTIMVVTAANITIVPATMADIPPTSLATLLVAGERVVPTVSLEAVVVSLRAVVSMATVVEGGGVGGGVKGGAAKEVKVLLMGLPI